MIIRLLIQLAALPLCLAEISAKSVHQSPPAMFKDPGEKVLINCSHSNSDFNMIQWYKQSTRSSEMTLIGYARYDSVTVEGPFKEIYNVSGDGRSLSSLHTLTLSGAEDSVVYFCAASGTGEAYTGAEAYFASGTKLTVLESNRTITPPKVKVLPPSQKECQNSKDKKNKKTLVCLGFGFYPDHVSVSWQIDGVNVTDGVATDNAALWKGEHYSITSRLRVPLRKWFTPGKRFTCTVNFFNGNTTVQRSHWVEGVEGPGAGAIREKYLRIVQAAKLSYALLIIKSSIYGAFVVFLVWRLQGSCGKQNN